MEFGALQGHIPRGQRGVAPQPAVRKVSGGGKAPKYDDDGGFDLYRARLESYLRQRDCWRVVIGEEGPDLQNVELNNPFEERNLFARDALLFGLQSKDAKKICKLSRASEMWATFVRDKTKRDYANIRVRAKLYGARYAIGMNMDKYLEDLEDSRRQLENMNAPIDDSEMTSIILTGVEATHRTVVRMFNRDENPPDLNRVLNTLRGEAEMDKAEEERQTSTSGNDGENQLIGSMKTRKGKQARKGKLPKKIGKTRYSPNGPTHHLISQEWLEQDGWVPTIPYTDCPEDRVMYFTHSDRPGERVAFRKRRGRYWLDVYPAQTHSIMGAVTSKMNNSKLLLWHMRFAHQNIEAMRKMVEREMVKGMVSLTVADFEKPFHCLACQRAKQRRKAYKRQQGKRKKECFARLMSDISPEYGHQEETFTSSLFKMKHRDLNGVTY
ncbi:LOW QUALITY PROTEIN: Hypothetical protein PHPALM_18700 [Phytophthora palmivora]|uniref:GAG-pre-integrase domain-containing protein n=1 Tax=Phytophthora palmivora TaxID=4796 RepID=A0A2P4XJ23_9STRA|nr:LOW QUALITY PROTEIN: Hypothetical protein PHPALM_18700 [Phytophthora palmivora]